MIPREKGKLGRGMNEPLDRVGWCYYVNNKTISCGFPRPLGFLSDLTHSYEKLTLTTLKKLDTITVT